MFRHFFSNLLVCAGLWIVRRGFDLGGLGGRYKVDFEVKTVQREDWFVVLFIALIPFYWFVFIALMACTPNI